MAVLASAVMAAGAVASGAGAVAMASVGVMVTVTVTGDSSDGADNKEAERAVVT